MDLNYSAEDLQPWGVIPFDKAYTGLPRRVFNLLRACNKEVNIGAIGHFLQTGLELGQKVVLVGFDYPIYLLHRFREYGFSFEDELLTERFIYLYYKPCFSHALSFTASYQHLFTEIKQLSRDGVGRLAFLNADVLFNLETHLLAELSTEKIMASFCDEDCVVLGCYQAAHIESHQRLDEVSQALLSSYIEIKHLAVVNDRQYELIIHKSPVMDTSEPMELRLVPGSGFNSPNIELIRHG